MTQEKSGEAGCLQARFGRRLLDLCMQRALTQEQLAEKTGLSVDFISLMERGRRTASFTTLDRLSKDLKVPIKDLFDFGEEP